MKLFFGYIILGVGIFTGIAANSFVKISDGFSKLTPTIVCLLLMIIQLMKKPMLKSLIKLL